MPLAPHDSDIKQPLLQYGDLSRGGSHVSQTDHSQFPISLATQIQRQIQPLGNRGVKAPCPQLVCWT